MSFLGKLGETLQDAGWFLGAPVAAAFDLAKASADDDPNTNFGSVMSTAFNRGTQLFFGDNAGTPDNPNDDTHNAIDPLVKQGMDGLEWVYDNVIAQPLNTAMITEQRGLANLLGVQDNASPLDIGSAWKRADEKTGGYAGKGTSIGRESAYVWSALLGGVYGETKSLTDEGQKALDEHSKLFDVESGALDTTARIFLDPTIVLGKVSKGFQAAKIVRGIKAPEEIATNLAEKGDGLFAGFGTRHDAAMDFIATPRPTGAARSAGEIYTAFKGLQDTNDGMLMAGLMESTVNSMLKEGAQAPAIKQQIALISRAGMGDGEALRQISDKATAAKDAIANFSSQRDELATAQRYALEQQSRPLGYVSPYRSTSERLGLEAAKNVAARNKFVTDVVDRGKDYFSSDEFLNMADARMNAVKASFDAAEAEGKRVQKIATAFSGPESLTMSLMDKPLLAALKGAGTRGLEKRAAKFTGEPARLDFVFQSSAWNYGVKLTMPHIYYGRKAYNLFNSPTAPRVLEFHDPNAAMSLNNFLTHAALSPGVREGLVSEMAQARDESAKRLVTTKAITAAQQSMVDAYKAKNPRFTDETAQIVKEEMAKQIQWERDRITAQVRKFTAHKNADGRPGDVRFDEQTGLASYHALLETQLENRMILPDLKAFDRVLSRHANVLTDMSAWAQGNRLPDQNRVKDIAAKLFDHKIGDSTLGQHVAPIPATANIAAWKTDRFIVDALTRFNTAWKFAALLRPAYPMRVLVDSDLRMLARTGPAAFAMHFMPRAFGFGTLGVASRRMQYFAAKEDDDMVRALETKIEQFEDTWKASNGTPAAVAQPPKAAKAAKAAKAVNAQAVMPSIQAKNLPKFTVPAGQSPLLVQATRLSKNHESIIDAIIQKHVGKPVNEKQLRAEVEKGLRAYTPPAGQSSFHHGSLLHHSYITDVQDALVSTLKAAPTPTPAVAPSVKAVVKRIQDDPEYAAMVKQRDLLTKKLEIAATGRRGRREVYGAFGDAGQNSIKTAAGEIPGAFADTYGRMRRWQYSSETSAAIIGDTNKRTMRNLLTDQWVHLDNSAPNHMDSWLHAINAQLLQSDLGKMALKLQVENGDDPAKAVVALKQWARGTKEGRALMDRLMWTAAPEDHAAEVVGYVNHYIPTPELREAATRRRLNQADLESAYPDPTDRPPVHGQALAMSVGRGSYSAKVANDFMSRTMKWLSDAPEDQLARHPLYAATYEQEAKRRAEFILADPRITHVSGVDVKELIQNQAHKAAGHAVKQTMFDIATRSDLSEAMRFVSPFIAAWEDTLRKWGRLAADDPSLLGKAYAAWNIPNGMGLVVDKDGNKVDTRDGFTDQHYVLVQWPSWVPGIGGKKIDLLPGTSLNKLTGGMVNADGTDFRIPKQALNIVLQGGLQPGFGPIVAYPVAKMQIAMPTLDDVASIVNPFGPPANLWAALAPSTLKRVEEAVNQQSQAHLADTERLFMQMQTEYRQDPEKFGAAPTWEQAAKRANSLGRLKILNNFVNPFPFNFDSKYKFYIDAYHQLQQQEYDKAAGHPRGWADNQFIKQYGESYFPLVQSMSKNNAGLNASAEAVDAANKFKSEIAKYGIDGSGAPDSTLVRLIVGPEGEGAFNQSAHKWQQTREISPGSGQTYRTYENPQEAAAQADTNLGWYKYRAFMDNLNAMANQNGNKTYRDDPELVATRAEFVGNLKAELPAWRTDWESMDTGKFTRNVESLAQVAQSPKYTADRTDMAGVREYMALRQAMQQKSADAGISETSQEAAPIRQEFTNAVMDLVSQNTQFSEWAFNGFLERDPLLEDAVVQQATAASGSTVGQWGF